MFKCKNKHPKWRGYGKISGSFYNDIKRAAKYRKIRFNISIRYLWELFVKQKGKCALSGVKLTLPRNSRTNRTRTASLDRINNNKGYIKGNVQWTHKTVNQIKHTLPQSEFIKFCKKIAKYLQ